MKVIKEGHFENKMTVRCNGCEAELEITSDDLTRFTKSQDCYYECPCCGLGHWVERNNLPIGVSKALK